MMTAIMATPMHLILLFSFIFNFPVLGQTVAPPAPLASTDLPSYVLDYGTVPPPKQP